MNIPLKRMQLLAATILSVLVAGQGWAWNQGRSDAGSTGYARGAKLGATLVEKWTAPNPGELGHGFLTPFLGRTYISSTAGLSAFDSRTGAMKWTYAPPGWGGNVIGFGAAACQTVNGKTRIYVSGFKHAAPFVSVHALQDDGSSFSVLWTRDAGASLNPYSRLFEPTLAGDLVYLNRNDNIGAQVDVGTTLCLRASDGATVFEKMSDGQFWQKPLVDGRRQRTYVHSGPDVYPYHSKMRCLDGGGNIVWESQDMGHVGGGSVLDAGANRLYVPFETSYAPGTCGVRCLDAATGTIVWETPAPGLLITLGYGGTPLTLANGMLYVTRNHAGVREIAALDAVTGTLAWSAIPPGNFFPHAALATADGLFRVWGWNPVLGQSGILSFDGFTGALQGTPIATPNYNFAVANDFVADLNGLFLVTHGPETDTNGTYLSRIMRFAP